MLVPSGGDVLGSGDRAYRRLCVAAGSTKGGEVVGADEHRDRGLDGTPVQRPAAVQRESGEEGAALTTVVQAVPIGLPRRGKAGVEGVGYAFSHDDRKLGRQGCVQPQPQAMGIPFDRRPKAHHLPERVYASVRAPARVNDHPRHVEVLGQRGFKRGLNRDLVCLRLEAGEGTPVVFQDQPIGRHKCSSRT